MSDRKRKTVAGLCSCPQQADRIVVIKERKGLFGYLRPEKDELKVREYTLYKSVYCGLCRHLGKDYGLLSCLTLSYDCTMLAMVSFSLKKETCTVHKGRCVVNPLKKCMFCDGGGEGFRLAGAVSVLMTYYKLTDTIQDSGFWKRTSARLLRKLMKRNYRKAAKAYPAIDEDCRVMMQRQREAEAAGSGVDKAADPTAVMLSSLCRRLSEKPEEQQILSHFGYQLGRWIYLMDAADDLEKDIRKGNFNPFRTKQQEEPENIMLYCNNVLNMTVSQLLLAYDLLELTAYKEILDNIVYHGLSFQQKYCLFAKKKSKEHHKKCRKKDRDYYDYLENGDRR